MFRIANLKIDLAVFDHLPESLARENCVLPIRAEGSKLHVVLGRRDDYRETIDKLSFVLHREIVCAVADHERLEKAIDELYSLRITEVKNCPIDFRVPCPRNWLELIPTGQTDVRFCQGCQLPVYLCQDDADAIRQASLGRCVAVFRPFEYGESVDCFLIGDVQIVE